MTKDKILIGNKLIVDFMGIKPKSVIPDIYYWNDAPHYFISEMTPEKVMDGIVSYVKYSTSWDWLIPVVNKICDTIGVKTIDECTDFEWWLFTALNQMKLTTPINIVFDNCIEYIKWYNDKKS